jgi:hypothetical protein
VSEDPNPTVANNGETTQKLIGGVTGKGFMPGHSGNPNGRPKRLLVDEALDDLLTTNDSSEAKAIAKVLIDRAKAGDVKAIQLTTERTQGKPKQSIGLSGGLELDSIAETLAAARKRVGDDEVLHGIERSLNLSCMSDEELQRALEKLHEEEEERRKP